MIAKKPKSKRPLAPGQQHKSVGMFVDAVWPLGSPEGVRGAVELTEKGAIARLETILKRAFAAEHSGSDKGKGTAARRERIRELIAARSHLEILEERLDSAMKAGIGGDPAAISAVHAALSSAAQCGRHIARYEAYFSSPRWAAKKGSGRKPKISDAQLITIERERKRKGGKLIVTAHANEMSESGYRAARKRNRRQ